MAVTDELKSKELYLLDIDDFKCKRNFYVIYHRNKPQSELFNRFLEHTKS